MVSVRIWVASKNYEKPHPVGWAFSQATLSLNPWWIRLFYFEKLKGIVISNHCQRSWLLCHRFNWVWLRGGLKYRSWREHLLVSFLLRYWNFIWPHFSKKNLTQKATMHSYWSQMLVWKPCLRSIPLDTKCLLCCSFSTFNLTGTKLYVVLRYKSDNVPMRGLDSPFPAWYTAMFKLWYLIIMLSNTFCVATRFNKWGFLCGFSPSPICAIQYDKRPHVWQLRRWYL